MPFSRSPPSRVSPLAQNEMQCPCSGPRGPPPLTVPSVLPQLPPVSTLASPLVPEHAQRTPTFELLSFCSAVPSTSYAVPSSSHVHIASFPTFLGSLCKCHSFSEGSFITPLTMATHPVHTHTHTSLPFLTFPLIALITT